MPERAGGVTQARRIPHPRRARHRAGRSARGAWPSRGAEGERHTALALSSLPERDWVVAHDVAWSAPDGFCDHVVLGPGGVFVVDSQHWPDGAELVDGVVRRRGRPWPWATRRALLAAEQLGDLVEGAGGLGRDDVLPVVSLHGVGPVAGRAGRVLVASPSTLRRVLVDQPPRLVAAEVDAVALRLGEVLRASS